MAKVWAFILYKAFLFISRRVSFTDFNRIWNEAYQAHVEAEWIKMKGIMGNRSNPTSFTITKSPQEELAEEAAARRKEMRYGPTWPPQGSNDGPEEKPLLSHSQE